MHGVISIGITFANSSITTVNEQFRSLFFCDFSTFFYSFSLCIKRLSGVI